MKLFILVILLNICTFADAQIRNNNDLLNAKINHPENVTITGGNILIYRWDNSKTTDNYSITTCSDSFHFHANDIPLELKPKTGVWYKPF